MCVFFTPFDTDIIAARLNFCSLQVNAFQRQGVFKNASVDQRKRFIVFAMRYMVTFMAILEKIYSALYSCRKGSESSVEDGTRYLDIAVGYYVGSLEGKDDGGSFDGSLIHMLAKRMCVHFGTCTASNHARINERIISLFYAGLGEVETGVSLQWLKYCYFDVMKLMPSFKPHYLPLTGM